MARDPPVDGQGRLEDFLSYVAQVDSYAGDAKDWKKRTGDERETESQR